MSYTVVWQPIAEQELAAVWLAAADQAAVTRAVAQLERELIRDPLHLGESRESSVHRVVGLPPVGLEYEVIADDQRVLVWGVFPVR